MKKLKLWNPSTPITSSQHCRCDWCLYGRDPKAGICSTCHSTFKKLLSGRQWTLLRRTRLAIPETAYCTGFLVATSIAMPPSRQVIVTALPPDITTVPADIASAVALVRPKVQQIATSALLYHVHCHAQSFHVIATVIDHILPWHEFPSLFWTVENHQSLCVGCHAMKTKLDGSHRNNPLQSR